MKCILMIGKSQYGTKEIIIHLECSRWLYKKPYGDQMEYNCLSMWSDEYFTWDDEFEASLYDLNSREERDLEIDIYDGEQLILTLR